MSRHRQAFVLVAVLGLLAAVPATASEGRGRLGDLTPAAAGGPVDPDLLAAPMRLSEPMKAWLAANVPRHAPTLTRLQILFHALQDSEDPKFEYRPGYTGTAEEVFESGELNCLSFSMLYVAMAREIRLSVYFLLVRDIQEFEKDGDLVVLSRHITAGYGIADHRVVLEFNVGPDVDYRRAEAITDLEAVALFYSNRGAELLREGDNREAAQWLETAVAIDGKLAQAWVNLGVARRRSLDLAAAEAAYRRAIELAPRNHSAYQNLSVLMRLRGEDDAAVLDLLDRWGNLNPFTFLTLGDVALERGRLDEARRYFRRALRLAGHEAEPNAGMGMWAHAAGRRDEAEKWLRKARRIDPRNGRTARLQALLSAAGDGTGVGPLF